MARANSKILDTPAPVKAKRGKKGWKVVAPASPRSYVGGVVVATTEEKAALVVLKALGFTLEIVNGA